MSGCEPGGGAGGSSYVEGDLSAPAFTLDPTLTPSVTVTAPVPVATGSPVIGGAPRLGEHSAQVLAEIGIDTAEIDRLVAAGVVGAEHGEPAPEPGDTGTVLTRGA